MIGAAGSNRWTKSHYPIIYRVLEYSDKHGVDVRQAAFAIEKERIELGDYNKLIASNEIKKFIGESGKGLRKEFHARLMSDGYASTLLDALIPLSAKPVEKEK